MTGVFAAFARRGRRGGFQICSQRGERDLRSGDGTQPPDLRRAGKLHRPGEVVMVGEGERRITKEARLHHQLERRGGPFSKREAAMTVELDVAVLIQGEQVSTPDAAIRRFPCPYKL